MIVLVVFALASSFAFADCSAPSLSSEKHNGTIYGFEFSTVWDLNKSPELREKSEVLIKLNNSGYVKVESLDTKLKPVLLTVDMLKVRGKLNSLLVASEHYLEPYEQKFTFHDILGYDLNEDKKLDLILFSVSLGGIHILELLDGVLSRH